MYVLVKYRHAAEGTTKWYQMDAADARQLFKNLKNLGLYWFCCVEYNKVHYWNSNTGNWHEGLEFLKYC